MRLPLELLLEIFASLVDQGRSGSLAAFCQASRQCNTLAKPMLYRSVVLRTDASVTQWPQTISDSELVASTVTRLELLSPYSLVLSGALVPAQCINLAVLRILLGTHISANGLCRALQHLPRLHTLSIIGGNRHFYTVLRGTLNIFARIHHLVLEFRGRQSDYESLITFEALEHLPQHLVFIVLQSLTLVTALNEGLILGRMQSIIDHVMQHAPGLKHASIIAHPRPGDADEALRAMTQELVMRNDRRITFAVLDDSQTASDIFADAQADVDAFQPWNIGEHLVHYD